MRSVESVAMGFAAVLAVMSGCSEDPASNGAGRDDGGHERWSPVAAEVVLPGGHTVSLQTAGTGTGDGAKTSSSRCWRVSEAAGDGTEIATSSACHGLAATAASRVFGVVVVASSCPGSASVRLENLPNYPIVREVFDGMFIVPPAVLPDEADTITYSCLDDNGGAGGPVTLDIAD
ncbi:hypothetical protein [Micromonospora sp. L31]|uniref:hypothetical protein n=1 Tax=Micromonospora sp. L31 TaxID=3452213 RepID=UPI003F88CA54